MEGAHYSHGGGYSCVQKLSSISRAPSRKEALSQARPGQNGYCLTQLFFGALWCLLTAML